VIAVGAAVLAGLALVGAGCGRSSTSSGTPTTTDAPGTTTDGSPSTPPRVTVAASAAQVRRLLRGIPQHGLVLGDPDAPVSIIEYSTLECPACAAVHSDILPTVIDRYVRTGKASLEFRSVAGDTSSPARDLALAAYAASAQGRGWNFLQLAYLRSLQGTPAGTTAQSIARLAKAAGLDATRLELDATKPRWLTEVRAAASVAAAARMSAFPVFLVRARAKPNTPFVVLTRPGSVRAFSNAVAKAARVDG
jgi:protein-disulfide isomerase